MTESSSPQFHIRRATSAADDGARCLQFFDSQLAWLNSKGSGEQWGTTSRGTDPKRLAEHREQMEFIDKSFTQPWGRDSSRGWIAEVDELSGENGERHETPARLAAGGLILKGQASDYVRKVLPEQQDVDDPYVFLYLLITNREAGEAARGAGAALIELAKSETRKLGFSRLCVDCWRGNGRRLVQYYESQGFQLVGEFEVKKPDGTIWEGAVLDMRL